MSTNTPMPRIVYLDHFVWSNFGKLKCGRLPADRVDIIGAQLEELVSRVSTGEIVCPISFAHAAELTRYQHLDARKEALTVMVTLSQGRCLPWVVIGDISQHNPQTCEALGLLPREADLRYLAASLDGLPPQLALTDFLTMMQSKEAASLSTMIEDFIQGTMADLRARPEGYFKTASSPNANTSAEWADEVFRRRMLNPQQRVEHGDAFDLMHLLYASSADAALIDRKHAKMMNGHKALSFWLGYRMDDLLTFLRTPRV